MLTDTQIRAFEEKLAAIEKDIAEENERANTKRMKARFFMFFLLIGADSQAKNELERKVRDLLRNPDACAFLQLDSGEGTDVYCTQLEDALLRAADKHIDVQNLNTAFFCPVVFADRGAEFNVVSILTAIDRFVHLSGRMPIWQPFVVLQRSVSQYKNIYSVLSKMQEFIRADRGGYINRCCLLSTQDGNGFSVPSENIMQTIAMTVVLQNVEVKNVGASQSINASVKIAANNKENADVFFTARNAAITNPIRSLVFQRMRSAVEYFSGRTDCSCERALKNIDYSFIGEVINPYIQKLPMVNGRVTFLPLYAVMNGPELQKRLQGVIDRYYGEPLQGDEAFEIQVENAREKFLMRFFEANGSLATLRELSEQKKFFAEIVQNSKNSLGSIPMEAPLPMRPKLNVFNTGLYQGARRCCEEMIQKAKLNLLEALSESLCDSAMLASLSHLEEILQEAKDRLADRIRTLRDVETLLVLDRTMHRTDFDSVQDGWFADMATEHPQKYYVFNKRFDALLFALLLEKDNVEPSDVMDICYQAIKGSGYSNGEYLERLSEECAVNEDRANEFAGIVERSWCYTMRLLKHDEYGDTTCIIGDPKNHFCGVLQQRFKASLFGLDEFDRIDVLHISAPFAPDNIWEWEQIKQNGGADVETSC